MPFGAIVVRLQLLVTPCVEERRTSLRKRDDRPLTRLLRLSIISRPFDIAPSRRRVFESRDAAK